MREPTLQVKAAFQRTNPGAPSIANVKAEIAKWKAGLICRSA